MRTPMDVERSLPTTCQWCNDKAVRWLEYGSKREPIYLGACKEHLGSCRYVSFVAGTETRHVYA